MELFSRQAAGAARHFKLWLPLSPPLTLPRARLHRAGLSICETARDRGLLVTGANGENAISVKGRSQAEAWHRAVEQAEAVGLVWRDRPTPPRHFSFSK